ncbi:MAG: hypothetical protein HY653_05660 [Acidobacteria bacterium]|nr:hypothetical protein [Acidobacteriota bacterium]
MVTQAVSAAEQQRLARAERRLGRFVLALVPFGTVFASWYGGWWTAAAFAFGGALAYLNYRWIVAVVDTLVRAGQARPTGRTYLKLFAPLALLAVVLYVIFARRWLEPLGVVSGLLVLAAAVLLELSYEIVAGLRR